MQLTELRSRLGRLLGTQGGPRVGISYAARTVSAAVLSVLVCRALHVATPIWAIVSAVVVILPEVHASVTSAVLRVLANIVGAGVGVAIGALSLPPMLSMALGLLAVAGMCRLIGIDPAARSASVAVIIVLLRDPHGVSGSSETRVALVMLGCAVALLTTIVAWQIERQIAGVKARRRPPSAPAPTQSGDQE